MDPVVLLALFAVVLFGGMIAVFWRPFWRIQAKRRANRYARYRPRNWWRRVRKKPVFEVDLPTVRDFVLTLQLSLSLAETMAGALNQAARQFGDRGTFGKRLITRVRSQLQVEPEAVIRAAVCSVSSGQKAPPRASARGPGISRRRRIRSSGPAAAASRSLSALLRPTHSQ